MSGGGAVSLRAHAGFTSAYGGSRDGSVTFTPAGDNRIAIGYSVHQNTASGMAAGYPSLDGAEMTALATVAVTNTRIRTYYMLNPSASSISYETRLIPSQPWVSYISAFDNVVQQAPSQESHTSTGDPTDTITSGHASDMVQDAVGRQRVWDHSEPAYVVGALQTERYQQVSPGNTSTGQIRVASSTEPGVVGGGTNTMSWTGSFSHGQVLTYLKVVPQRNNVIMLLSLLPMILIPAGFGKILIPQMLGLWKELF